MRGPRGRIESSGVADVTTLAGIPRTIEGMPRVRILILPAAIALTLAACSSEATPTADVASAPPAPTSAPSASTPTAAGDAPSGATAEILDFTLDGLGGGTVMGADYAGTPLAIWFWAPW